MTKALVIGVVVLAVTLVIIGGLVARFMPLQRRVPSATGDSLAPPSVTPSRTVVATSGGLKSSAPTATRPVSPAASVKFALVVSDITGSGLSRNVTAQLSNLGSADAHNVWAKIEATSGGAKISLNGQEYVRVDVGLLPAGTSITKQVTLSFSILEGLKISQQGVHLVLSVIADEAQDSFTYDYQP